MGDSSKNKREKMPSVTVQECQLISREWRDGQPGNVAYRVQFVLNRGLPVPGGAATVAPLNIELGGRFVGLLGRERADVYERRHRGLAADAEIQHAFYSTDNEPQATRGINGELFGDEYRLFSQLSPLAGNYCI